MKNNVYVELLRNLLLSVKRFDREFIKENNLDISSTELNIIQVIKASSKRTMTVIADKLAITLGTFTISVNKLVEKGYLIKRKKDNDKRIIELELTNYSEEILKKIDIFSNNVIERLLSNNEINSEDLESLGGILEKVNHHI